MDNEKTVIMSIAAGYFLLMFLPDLYIFYRIMVVFFEKVYKNMPYIFYVYNTDDINEEETDEEINEDNIEDTTFNYINDLIINFHLIY